MGLQGHMKHCLEQVLQLQAVVCVCVYNFKTCVPFLPPFYGEIGSACTTASQEKERVGVLGENTHTHNYWAHSAEQCAEGNVYSEDTLIPSKWFQDCLPLLSILS